MAFTCTVSEHVNASPEAVFAAASDFANAPTRIPGIKKTEMLTHGPVGVGTKFRETRVMFGKEATETMEIVGFEPGRSYTLRAFNCGCEYKTTVSVRPAGSGGARGAGGVGSAGASEITFDFSAVPQSFGARVMSAAMGWMMKGTCVKMIRQDLTSLKAALEKPAAT